MVDIAGLYFVIANAGRARFVRPGPDSRLHTIRTVSHTNQPDQQVVNPVFERETSSPRGANHVGFARQLAELINDDCAVDLFRYLVLIAPPDMLCELTSMIDGPTGANLIGSLARDLVTVPDSELWRHLDEWVSPAVCA